MWLSRLMLAFPRPNVGQGAAGFRQGAPTPPPPPPGHVWRHYTSDTSTAAPQAGGNTPRVWPHAHTHAFHTGFTHEPRPLTPGRKGHVRSSGTACLMEISCHSAERQDDLLSVEQQDDLLSVEQLSVEQQDDLLS